MLSQEENALLTQTDPGTPMGNLLRRYWQPVAAVAEMEDRWTKRVRVMGEDLVLFKDRTGKLGLIGEQCPHRRASLAYGIPTQEGIRCPYHGWMFDGAGTCLEQPNEPEGSTFKDKVSLPGYPVQVLAGLVFAYLGPLPAPLITKLDGYVAEPAIRLIARTVIPCNWLQIQENSADPIHIEWLHGHFAEFVDEQFSTRERLAFTGRHLKIAFDEKPYGIIKRRLKEGQPEDCSDWTVGHPLVFPNILAVGSADKNWHVYEFQIRVPEDDMRTTHWWFTAFVPTDPSAVDPVLLSQERFFEVPIETEVLDTAEFQDIMAWSTQGGIADRTAEHLGSTDRGITMFRNMLRRELKKIEAGEDPILVNRDPAADAVLDLPLETDKAHYSNGFEKMLPRRHWRYAGIDRDLLRAFGIKREKVKA
ncbi:MAG: Rieske 2Fe-2S domain-containing protein [Candidatus Eremiobacteraeota bacterium]|nr:Rieske 2Fe-2S domain-containing protein [Candidatus Eremiobacteraeota bacterium]